jgi:cell wall-associated NlpC family hydrolase
VWSDAWVGLPYAELGRGPRTYDCLGLFLALQRARRGRDLPDPACRPAEAVRRGVVDRERPRWRRVEAAREGDALLFRERGRALHVAYALSDREMLHTEASLGASAIEAWRTTRWLCRLEGVYRHAG